MAEFFFGVGRGKVSKREYARVEAIAKSHYADFTNLNMPEGPRFWFSCQNLGEPFNSRTAARVMAEVGKVEVMPS